MRIDQSYVRWGLLLFCFAILAGSSIPGDQLPKAFKLTPDKLIHCVEYFILGLLIFQWLRVEFNLTQKRLLFFYTVLIGSVFGAIDENYQRLTPGRMPDGWDWVLDTIGILMAATVSYFARSKNKS